MATTPARLLEALQANGYAWVKSVRKLAALLAPLGLGRENGRPVRLAYPPTQADRVARPSPSRSECHVGRRGSDIALTRWRTAADAPAAEVSVRMAS